MTTDRPTVVNVAGTVATVLSVAVLVFLLWCGFFSAWQGRAAGWRGPADAPWRAVWIVDDAGDGHALTWRRALVDHLDLPHLSGTDVPDRAPADAPTVSKSRFSLHLDVRPVQGEPLTVATTSPMALGVAVLAGLLTLFLRNMLVAGSPLRLAPGPARQLRTLPTAGQPAQQRRDGGGKGPPPRTRAKGQGRRG